MKPKVAKKWQEERTDSDIKLHQESRDKLQNKTMHNKTKYNKKWILIMK